MYMVIQKQVNKIQRKEAVFSFLKKFWEERKNRPVILFVYEKAKLLTLISYLDFLNMRDENSLAFYLDFVHNNRIWGHCDASEISDALERMPYVTYLILEENAGLENTTFAYSRLDAEVQHYVSRIRECLENRGISVFGVNIPMVQEIDQDKATNSTLCYVMYSRFLTSNEFRLPLNIEKVTNLPESELKEVKSLWFKKLGDAEKKIYLVGPCIVAGTGNPPGERLGDILYQRLRELRLDKEYEIEFVPLQMDESLKLYNILEYDISSRDIVIIVHYNMYECELDLTRLYNSWGGQKWLYQDKPVHTTITGNEMIANNIIEKIIRPVYENGETAQISMWHGEPQFSVSMEFDIAKYIKKIQSVRKLPQTSTIGAIVMNCNPFTLGHRYLIEYAAERVDYLYIFAVEEDLSVFPFWDRYALIKEGTKDIENVVVVPSGQFIISRVTFFSYFEKDVYTENANAEEDVYIFARYIAKGLGITRRFVGEEPTDRVTDSYNRTMKEVFPKYGIDLVEIPRKQTAEGDIISASRVRALLKDSKWEEIGRLVPWSTLEYLKQNREDIQRRSITKNLMLSSYNDSISEIVQRICQEEKVVIYTIGEDTSSLIKKIPEEVQQRLVYADKMAECRTVYFQGKQVVAPKELLNAYKEYIIVIPTVKYGPEIYRQFIHMGIDVSRCIFNISRF